MDVKRSFDYWKDMLKREGADEGTAVNGGGLLTIAELLRDIRDDAREDRGHEVKQEEHGG